MRRLLMLVVCLAGVWSGGLRAQSTNATITGYVTDSAKAAIVGARIIVINVATNARYETVTNGTGGYDVTGLPPGPYRIEVEKPGFKAVVKSDLVLHVQDTAAVNFDMAIGSVSEVVTVEAGGLVLNTTNGSVSTVIDRHFVENLPLNGRSFQSLILLTPGATITPAGVTSDFGQFSVNGQRANTNAFIVDGVSANIGIAGTSGGATHSALAGSYPGLSAFGGTNNLVSVDALEEYKIQTSTFTAEFGRHAGGQISLVTRSGTNQFRGTLFEYFRNDALDARDYFNRPPAAQPALRQNQFGGTLGGPIAQDRAFFFFSYEAQRLRLPLSGVVNVPSLRVREAAAPAVQPFLDTFPRPTGEELRAANGQPSGWAPFAYSLSNPNTLDATSLRLDHRVSGALNVFGRYNESPSSTLSQTGGASGIAIDASTRTVTVGATSTLSPRITNELRFNYSSQLGRSRYEQATYGGAVPVDPSRFTNGLGGVGFVSFVFGGASSVVYGGDFTTNTQRQINIVDNVSVVAGAHQFKFGVDFRRLSPTYGVEDKQYVYFRSEAAVNSATASDVILNAYDLARPRFTNLSLYGQDNWRVTPRLTLNLGVRWELNPAPSEADGKLPVVATGVSGEPADVSQAALAPPGTPFYKTFYTAFAPRVGAAYLLNGTRGREAVLRGGLGVYFDTGAGAATSGFPLTANRTRSAVPFPLSAEHAARPEVAVPTSLPVSTNVFALAGDLKLPYTLQWNLAVEQSLGTRQSLSLSYVASAARRLLTTQRLNSQVGFNTGPRPNPDFTNIYYTWNGPTSDYHSLQAQYRARFTRGSQALINYAWAHAIDEVSSDAGLYVRTRGNADFDIRHNFSAAVVWNLPAPSIGPVLTSIARDWTVNAIVHAQSGRPVNVQAASSVVDGLYVHVRPDVVPGQPFYIEDPSVPGGRRFNPAAFTMPPTHPVYPTALQQGTLGRNVLRDLPLSQVDFALARSFRLTERVKLQFKGEVFNLFNHPMFALDGLSTSLEFPDTFGVPSTTLRNALSDSVSGLSPLYQVGGPRSVQLSLRLAF